MQTSKLPKIIVIVLIVVIIVGYGIFQVRNLAKGPVLIITSPTTGTTFNEQKIFVRGVIENASHATLNGRKIFIDEEGNFEEIVLLSEGYNLVEIEIEDKFERKKKETLELVFSP